MKDKKVSTYLQSETSPQMDVAWRVDLINNATKVLLLLLLLHKFNGLFSKTARLSWYQTGKTSLDLKGKRSWGFGMQWHQLDHMQTICTWLQTNNHSNTSSLNFFTGQMLFQMPNQECQSNEGNKATKVTLRRSAFCNSMWRPTKNLTPTNKCS